MKRTLLCVLLISLLDLSALAKQKVFAWVSANNETVQLDPADYHSGRVYRPGPDGGNIHVGIQAKQPVTIAVMWVDEWRAAQQHPETLGSLNYRCVREHVLSTTRSEEHTSELQSHLNLVCRLLLEKKKKKTKKQYK